MRMVLYVVIIAALCLAPLERLNVADLEPVQVVAVYAEDGLLTIKTDTDDVGKGADVQKALADMKARTATVIYLDTAEYLLVEPGTEEQARILSAELKSGVRVAPYNGGDLQQEAKYADLHNDLPKLRKWIDQAAE